MKMGELKYLSDETLEELEKEGVYWEFTPKMAQRYVLYSEIVSHLISGHLIGYKIECPYCGETYRIPLSDFNYNNFIKCYKCNKEYRQDNNIIAFLYNEMEKDND